MELKRMTDSWALVCKDGTHQDLVGAGGVIASDDGSARVDCDASIDPNAPDVGLIAAAKDLLSAANAALAYDKAINACADDPARMSSYCTAQGDNLDSLYSDWIGKARAAIAKATGAAP